jgi:hypothetical protein
MPEGHGATVPFPSAALSIPIRFLDLIVRSLMGSLKHHLVHIILLAGAALYDHHTIGSLKEWREHTFAASVPFIWALCVAIIWHSIWSAIILIGSIRSEHSQPTEVAGSVVSVRGEMLMMPAKPIPPPRFYRIKVWLTASLLMAMSGGLSIAVWAASITAVRTEAHTPSSVPVPTPNSGSGIPTGTDSKTATASRRHTGIKASTTKSGATSDDDKIRLRLAEDWAVTSSMQRQGPKDIEHAFSLHRNNRILALTPAALRLYFDRKLDDSDRISTIDPVGCNVRKGLDYVTIDQRGMFGGIVLGIPDNVSFRVYSVTDLRHRDLYEVFVP